MDTQNLQACPFRGPNPMVEAFKFDSDSKELKVLDQTLLPHSISFVDVPDSEKGFSVIKNMMVRGAPCIAAVGCLSIITELNHAHFVYDKSFTNRQLVNWIITKANYIVNSRPTAVNLKNALDRIILFAKSLMSEISNNMIIVERLTSFCLDAIRDGELLNRRLGDYGADEILKHVDRHAGVTVLTHCNTGSLATVGYGTALGVIRSLRNKSALKTAFCTETRPYNQGSRLTAWELVREKMPATLIADSMVAYLMSSRKIDAVLVGADCVAANGDTANKIGTLQIAITAKYFEVPFYVAAPTQSIDLSVDSRKGIKIELRPSQELRQIENVVLAPDEVDVWNPCFDITPASLITGIITEFGVCKPAELITFMERVNKENKGPQALF